ncbi:PA2778 family cysteine peptidase [Halomonas lysinitropha]|uniref:Tetratricopeptide repeat protein n=1 Tax=Halomonas lysinitropha TaxID=2607506 RepID=A0A5K1I589_9GAMM|nr:PA2778 family cysteine peptidase [Halomonas lysinitropha]VVZ96525.1 Tetratricopeptide repeat protein [Halomonas lysinitropha]
MTPCPSRHFTKTTFWNARLAGVLALALVMLIMAGCASTPQLAETTKRELPRQTLLEQTPFHGQRDYQCGPASLAMVLNASDVPVEVDTLIPQVFLPEREGSVQPEMLATVRRHGRIPFMIKGNLDALLTEIDAGHPTVVMQNLSLPAWPIWHYAVAIGFDLDEETLILHSGMEPERIESFKRFDATWARSDRWAFVALPPGTLPATTDAEAAMDAIVDFERVQGEQAALLAWEALIDRHPEHAMGHFALGNARYATGDRQGAIAAFEGAVAQDPDLAVAWLNLGLLQQEMGNVDQAREALQLAAAHPGAWQNPARQALDGLKSGD